MKPIDKLKSNDPNIIYCIGDNTTVLKFEIGEMCWFRVPIDNDKRSKEAFDGTLRYSSSCFVPPMPDEKIIVTGGCFETNGFPSSNVTEFAIKNLRMPIKKRPMHLMRYGHLSCYMNGFIYCLGGFSHKDLPNELPVTLNACEKFSITAECQWSHISSMCEPRAFSSFVTFNS
jgi:hypothetical protein